MNHNYKKWQTSINVVAINCEVCQIPNSYINQRKSYQETKKVIFFCDKKQKKIQI